MTREREDAGVRLYELQQRLAQLLTALQHEAQQAEAARLARDDHDDELVQLRHERAAREEKVKSKQKESQALEQRAQSLSHQVRDVYQQYSTRVSEEETMRHQAQKIGRTTTDLEQQKKQQDLLVDSMSERAKELERELKMLKTRKQAQEEETRETRAALREAQCEVDAIALERRELDQQWGASNLGLSRRNEALTAMQAAVREQRQQVYARQLEMDAVKKAGLQEQEKAEVLADREDRINAEIQDVKRKTQKLQEQRATAEAQYSFFEKSLRETQESLTRVTAEYNHLQTEAKGLQTALERLAASRRERRQALDEALHNHQTMGKAGKSTYQQIVRQRKLVDELEAQVVAVENDIAHKELETHEWDSKVADVRAQLFRVEAALTEVTTSFAGYERQLAHNQSEVARKQRHIDQLNRKLADIKNQRTTEGSGKVDMSPAEVHIQHLQKQVSRISDDCGRKQQQWLAKQNELVNLSKALQSQRDSVEDMKTKVLVFSQKKYRLETELESHQRDVARSQTKFVNLRQELTRANQVRKQRER